MTTLTVGAKCAVMLPQKLVNTQITPAKGMVINRLLDSRSLILVEEIWQFKGLKRAPITEMIKPDGKIKHNSWGWREVPQILEQGDYLVLPAWPHNIMELKQHILDAMIKKSIADFKRLNGF
jgi:hypothetical protein